MRFCSLVCTLRPRVGGSTAFVLTIVPLVVAAAAPNEPTPWASEPRPSPVLEPAEVVRIQVEALRRNGALNEGIELTYRFASPDNKRYTGPLNRFIGMVRSAPYARLLNHLEARYGQVAVSGNAARQLVTITDEHGEEAAYLWVLSRQGEGRFKDCWMTDAVIPVERPLRGNFAQTSTPTLEAGLVFSG